MNDKNITLSAQFCGSKNISNSAKDTQKIDLNYKTTPVKMNLGQKVTEQNVRYIRRQGQSEAVNRRRLDNTMAHRKGIRRTNNDILNTAQKTKD